MDIKPSVDGVVKDQLVDIPIEVNGGTNECYKSEDSVVKLDLFDLESLFLTVPDIHYADDKSSRLQIFSYTNTQRQVIHSINIDSQMISEFILRS
jgi:hypothetical protein